MAGIVLAAGASSRLGRNKLLLDLEGRPVLQHVLDAACRSRLRPIVVVLGFDAERVRSALDPPVRRAVRFVVNRDYADGQSTSVRVGLAALPEGCEAVAILLGDQPSLEAALIDHVLDAFATVDRLATPIVRPFFTNDRGCEVPGHPVVLDRCVWPQLEQQRGDRGARDLIAADPSRVLRVPTGIAAPPDIDTEADWLRLRESAMRHRR